jgi:predicted PurR-regulated permease PerM
LITRRISKHFYECVFEIDEEISDYLRSMAALMVIRSVEYSLLYLLVGHPDWLILGIASSVSLIIPYVGPTSVNTVGILSALQLPTFNVVLLIALIVILAQIDEYVITPMVHSHNLKLSPMWILFSIFASSTLFGVGGFIIAIPMYLIIRTVIRMYLEMDAEEMLKPQKEETA